LTLRNRSRHRQRDRAQILGSEPQVHRGALRRAMAQYVADGFQRHALAEEMESIRVANAMDPFEGNLQATPAGPRLECLDYCCRLQNTARRLEAKEHLPVVA